SLSLPSPPVTPFAPLFSSIYSCSSPTFCAEQRSNKQSRVLLIDDNPINLQILARLLKIYMTQVFCHIAQVDSGIKGLELLSNESFDIVLMDIDMPIMNGIDTTRHLRSSSHYNVLASNRTIPVVAVTTNDSAEWRHTYTRVGMNGCIGKPISPIVLKQTLGWVLQLGPDFPFTP
ncbi:CheY-like superfamily, partial [Spinellus fusiger]